MVPHNSLFRGNLHHLFYSVQNLAERTHACNINSRRLLSKAAPPIDSTITPQADQRVQRKLSQSKPNVLLKPETTLYVYQVYNSDFKNSSPFIPTMSYRSLWSTVLQSVGAQHPILTLLQ